MANVSVDLAKGQLEFIEVLIDRGVYRSRSEAVRDVLRRAEFDWGWKEGMREAADKGIRPDLEKARKRVSRKLLKRFAGVL